MRKFVMKRLFPSEPDVGVSLGSDLHGPHLRPRNCERHGWILTLVAYGVSRDRDELAGAVWIAAVAYCAVLAAAGMAVTIAAAAHADGSFSAWWIVFGVMLVGVSAAFGVVIGAVLGVPLGLLVTFFHRRLGVRGVSILIPIVTILVTEAIFVLIGVRSVTALAVVAFLSLVGALMIDRHYQRAARKYPVH
jgi:hypothetical protein